MTHPLTGRGVLVWLGVFFACIFAVNVYFIVISVETFRGEDEQKPYLQGIEYNTTLERRAAQARLGWKADVAVQRLKDGHVRIEIGLKDAAGRAPGGAVLAAELRHPADENRDHVLRVVAAGGGRYWADAGNVTSGVWDILLSNDNRRVPFEATARLWVP
ncbi:MAG: FixH family protein [Rhizomicrobium sp.]